MIRTRTIASALAIAVPLAIALVWPAGALASQPPASLTACTDDGNFSSATVRSPVLVGKTVTVTLHAVNLDDLDTIDDVWVTQDGLDFEHYDSYEFSNDGFNPTFAVTAEPGATEIDVIVVLEAADGGQCGQELSVPFKTIERPTKAVTVRASRSSDNAFDLDLSNAPLSPFLCRDAAATIRVSLDAPIRPLTIRLPSICNPHVGKKYTARAPGLWVTATLEMHFVRINFDPRRLQLPTPEPFRVSYRSAEVSRGWIARYRYWVDPVRSIPQSDFDNWYNICVVGNIPTYASGGQLWCDVGGGEHSTLAIKKLS
jgi:hypothetical protein